MRSYSQYCAVAKALDVIGDRWNLLIVRELLLRGPCRYVDLQNGLPGIATNLLADRLRELEQAGVVLREEAPPPIATALFRLTPRGEALRPVLEELIRWGAPLMAKPSPDDEVRSHWLAWAIPQMLSDRRPELPPVTLELRTGDQPIVIAARDGALEVELGGGVPADATLTGPAQPILGLLVGLLEPADAEARGVSFDGDRSVLDRIGGELERLGSSSG